MIPADDRKMQRAHPDAEAWADRADELAEAALGLLNRTDCCGGYFGPRPTTHKEEYARNWQPLDQALRSHFVGKRIIGLHTTSLANTCNWMAFDLDAHEGATAANMKPALEIAARIRAIGLTPYIFDSNGKGGLHVWAVFKQPRKTHQVFELARRLAGVICCEAFPKQPHVEPGRYGNWLRLPGKHYKRNYWSRLLTEQGWASADETIDAVCEMCCLRSRHERPQECTMADNSCVGAAIPARDYSPPCFVATYDGMCGVILATPDDPFGMASLRGHDNITAEFCDALRGAKKG